MRSWAGERVIVVGELENGSVEAAEAGELLSEGRSFDRAEAVVAELRRRRKKGILRLGRRKVGYVGEDAVFDLDSIVGDTSCF